MKTLALLVCLAVLAGELVGGDGAVADTRDLLPPEVASERGNSFVERRQLSIVRVLTRRLPQPRQDEGRKELSFGENEDQDFLGEVAPLQLQGLKKYLQTQPTDWHCSSNKTDHSAQCCFNFAVRDDNGKIDLAGCLTFKYIKKSNAINVAIHINGYMIVQWTFSLDKPSPICLNLFVGELCAVFSDISLKPFDGCLDLTLEFLGKKTSLGHWCW